MKRLVLTVAVLSTAAATAGSDEISYTRDVRPILAANCFACHGPDEHAREADLRLDLPASAMADLGGYQAISPGHADKSEALLRITSEDPDRRMPPLESNKTISAKEIDLLKRWIDQGARYETHWAFTAPHRAELPAVQLQSWPRNAIDRFVLSRLEAEGLSPSEQADSYTLIRRLFLDLIGLPPTVEEADEWAARLTASTADAALNEQTYGQLVDSLLNSPHYGERWARQWLDLARYADTNGYEKDRPREIWPYRDWVIRALNDDMPFDRFTIAQIAGDMLPGSSQDDLIATGFHRNTMLNEEGGIDPLEFRFYAMNDRVATTGTAWLALTLGCAQCHTHKYDPITHSEYYRIMALLNNADEPQLDLTTPELEATRAAQSAEAKKLLKELPDAWPQAAKPLEEAFSLWLGRQRTETVAWTNLRPDEAASNLPLLTVQDDDSVFASGDITKDDTYTLTFHNPPGGIAAIRLEALPDPRLPASGPGMTYYEGRRGDFFLGEFQVFLGEAKQEIAAATESYAKNQFGANPVSASLATDGDPQTGWSCADRMGEAHQAVFVLASPIAAVEAGRPMTITLRFGRHYACSLGRFRLSVSTAASGKARDMPRAVDDLLALPDEQLSDDQRAVLREYFLLTAPELKEQAQQIRRLQAGPAPQPTLILRQRPPENPRPTFRHHRGEFLQTKEQVAPGVPEFLPPLPNNLPPNRLAFARWLAAPDNPLTARVAVNRQWESLFGRGLVATSGDFGFQGDYPSHPKLLDWLACEFVEPTLTGADAPAARWSLKHIHRLIVTSATYRQSSRIGADQLANDPHNRLLSRAPRVRIAAELVRDAALRASGLLSEKLYGPPVRPPQPASVLEAAYGGGGWQVSQGEDRYRRGIYTFIKRTAPYAMFNTFDAPSGEVCVARRDISNTPLQALTLLNDEVLTEAAQALGRAAMLEDSDDRGKATLIFRRCVTRRPANLELERMLAFVVVQRDRLKKNETDAQRLSSLSDANAAEQAVWTSLARAILNLDETITKN